MGRALIDVAEVIRSKNAGPYELTFDIIFKDFQEYQKVKEKGVINKELIMELYQLREEQVVSIINYDPAKAIKITIIRPVSAGAAGERDVYGAQQHAPLCDIKI